MVLGECSICRNPGGHAGCDGFGSKIGYENGYVSISLDT